jgi:CHASE3 domain sensor protein
VHFTWAEVTVLAIVTGSMIAGFIGWTIFIVNRSDRERKRVEEALQLPQEHLDRLLNMMEEPENEARLRKLAKAGVAGALLLTGLLGLLSWRMALQAAEDADWVAHAHQVTATLEVTLRHVVDVETGARGFALTGHEPFWNHTTRANMRSVWTCRRCARSSWIWIRYDSWTSW